MIESKEVITDVLLKREVNKNIRQLFSLQEQRVLLSNEFDIKFKEYLLDAPKFNIDKLKSICKLTSDDMNAISKQIIEIKLKFSNNMFNLLQIFDLIERLQENEQAKFQLTVEMYLTEQERLEKLSQTDEFELSYNAKINSIKKKLNDTKQVINECLEELRYELFDDVTE